MQLHRTQFAAIAAVLALGCSVVTGCASEPAAASETGGNAPAYFDDVEPILRVQCTGCHRADGAAPFALDNYELARTRADEIARVTAEHRMPPWPARASADCPELIGARELDETAIATLQAWAEAGAPEGKAPPASKRPTPAPRADELDHVDAVLQNAEPYVPRPRVDDHRCFALDPQLNEDRYLTAYAVREGVPGIIHHVQLWAVDDEATEQQLDAFDAADSELGYACPQGHSLSNARYVSVWAPSDPVRRHPPGTGVLLRAGHRLLIQIHYNDRQALGLPDRTAIELELADAVDHPASMWTVSNGDILLPPGVERTTVQALFTVPDGPALSLWGVRAHMHELGSSAQLAALGPHGTQCLLSIPRWDPAWQLMYFYPTPITLQPDDMLSVECNYDTRSQTEPVSYGVGIADEMCFGYFYVTGAD